MRAVIALLFVVLAGSTGTALAGGDVVVVEYFGPHPIDRAIHGGLCVIEGPHVHSYAPHDEVLYVTDGPYYTFVGDPTEFEPEAPEQVVYYGHHPVFWTHAPGEHYCYITGPHHHGHAPPATLAFTERGGAYWYVGAHPVWYERHKKRHGHRVDAHYHGHVIARPVVAVSPPVGWVGITFDAGGVGIGFGAAIGTVPVVVDRPPPVIIVDEHDHHHHHHHPPKWGHHKDHPGFGKHHKPGKHHKHGKGGKHK